MATRWLTSPSNLENMSIFLCNNAIFFVVVLVGSLPEEVHGSASSQKELGDRLPRAFWKIGKYISRSARWVVIPFYKTRIL